MDRRLDVTRYIRALCAHTYRVGHSCTRTVLVLSTRSVPVYKYCAGRLVQVCTNRYRYGFKQGTVAARTNPTSFYGGPRDTTQNIFGRKAPHLTMALRKQQYGQFLRLSTVNMCDYDSDRLYHRRVLLNFKYVSRTSHCNALHFFVRFCQIMLIPHFVRWQSSEASPTTSFARPNRVKTL